MNPQAQKNANSKEKGLFINKNYVNMYQPNGTTQQMNVIGLQSTHNQNISLNVNTAVNAFE